MVLYVRFLKPPRCTRPNSNSNSNSSSSSSSKSNDRSKHLLVITALVTITSDLGESFYPDSATLRADLLRSSSTTTTTTNDPPPPPPSSLVLHSSHVPWKRGSRNVRVEMKISVAPGAFLDGLIMRVSSVSPRPADNLLELAPGFGTGVLSAWSAPFGVPGIGVGASTGVGSGGPCAGAEYFVERRLRLGESRCVGIWEETGESIARHIWDGGVALTSYLAQYGTGSDSDDRNNDTSGPLCLLHRKFRQASGPEDPASPPPPPLNILELGSGCGIVGISLAALRNNCHVTLTDLPLAEEIAVRNIRRSQAQLQGTVSFQVYDWEDPLPPCSSQQPQQQQQRRPSDIILIADCTYNPDNAVALVQALLRCVDGSKDTVIVLAHKKRHESEGLFFDLMRKHFEKVDYWCFSTHSASRQGDDLDESTVNLYTFRLLPL